ncbi:MAG: DUF72 domain-containing protein, partial [Planctomycetota bacterium]
MSDSELKIKGTDTQLYVGTAGWSYDDWTGIVYPKGRKRDFRGLQYLAENMHFNTVELNNTFYHPPRAKYCRRWLRDVESRPDFTFTAKLWKRFTHEREDRWGPEDVVAFREGIAPLVGTDKLGAVLVQFPWSFRFKPANMRWLAHLVDAFRDLPLVVELRSKGWLENRAVRFLEEMGVGFCNIDQPGFRNNIPLTARALSTVGYMRLHGRNKEAWFSNDAGRDERYDYLYSPEELRGIQQAVEKTAEQVQKMFVIANNHYRGQAPAN